MNKPRYDEKKATQVAAYFLSKHNNKISKLKLLKLMYIAERESFKICGEPMTFDDYYSLECGPILSQTYNFMKGSPTGAYWGEHILQSSQRELQLINNPGIGKLNPEEKRILDNVFEKYGRLTPSQLIRITHRFPEYTETISSIPIEYSKIMEGVGIPKEEVEELLNSYSVAIDL